MNDKYYNVESSQCQRFSVYCKLYLLNVLKLDVKSAAIKILSISMVFYENDCTV